jgi:hypothetical protein
MYSKIDVPKKLKRLNLDRREYNVMIKLNPMKQKKGITLPVYVIHLRGRKKMSLHEQCYE